MLSCTCLRKAYLDAERSSGPPLRGGFTTLGLRKWVPFSTMACCSCQCQDANQPNWVFDVAHPSIFRHIPSYPFVPLADAYPSNWIETRPLLHRFRLTGGFPDKIKQSPQVTKGSPKFQKRDPPGLSSRKRPVSTYSAMNRSMCFTNALLACRHGKVSIGLVMSKVGFYSGYIKNCIKHAEK